MKAILFVLLLSFRVFAGPSISGGGDWAAAEFAKYAKNAIQSINEASPVVIYNFRIDEKRLHNTFEKLSIKSVTGPLLLNGHAVTAINTPSKNEILIDRNIWRNITHAEKVQIVIHEILGLTFSEISDANYIYSEELTKLALSNEEGFPSAYWKCQCFENENASDTFFQVIIFDLDKLKEAEKKTVTSCKEYAPKIKSKIVARCHRYADADH